MTTQDQQQRLWTAAQNGDCAEIRRAIISGAVIDARDEDGRTAMNMASQNSHADAIRTLIAAQEIQDLATAGVDPKEFWNGVEEKQKVA